MKPKPLGQIAYEAFYKYYPITADNWKDRDVNVKKLWQHSAASVAREVKRRGRKK